MKITEDTDSSRLARLSLPERGSHRQREQLERLAGLFVPPGTDVFVRFHETSAFCRPLEEDAGADDRGAVAGPRAGGGPPAAADRYEVAVPAESIPQPYTDLPARQWDHQVKSTFLFHELGHVLYSDLAAFGEKLDELYPPYDVAFRELYNAAEDGVVETQMARQFDLAGDFELLNATLVEDATGGDAGGGRTDHLGHLTVLEALTVGILDRCVYDSGRFARAVDPDDETYTVGAGEHHRRLVAGLEPAIDEYVAAMLSEPDGTDRVALTAKFLDAIRSDLEEAPWTELNTHDVDALRPDDVVVIDAEDAEDSDFVELLPQATSVVAITDPETADRLPDTATARVHVADRSTRGDDGDDDAGGDGNVDAGDADDADDGADPGRTDGDGAESGDDDAGGSGQSTDDADDPDGSAEGADDADHADESGEGTDGADDADDGPSEVTTSFVGSERPHGRPSQNPGERLRSAADRYVDLLGSVEEVEEMSVVPPETVEGDRERWRAIRADARRLERELETALRRQRRTRYRGGFRTGRLDTHRLTRVTQGSTDVFRRRSPSEGGDYTCLLVLDRSGSMDGLGPSGPAEDSAVRAAEDAVGQLAVALSAVGVDVSVLSMFEGAPTLELPFDADPDRYADVLTSGRAEGGTPLSEAVALARERVTDGDRSEPLVIVVTDGEPDDVDRYRAALRRCTFPVYGVYVDVDPGTHADYFDRVVYSTADELTGTLRDLARHLLAPTA